MINVKHAKKYLPVGSVVLIKQNIKTIMIVGYKLDKDKKDYAGVYYPEGYTTNENLIYFNHEDISNIFQLGLEFEKQKNYNKYLLGNIDNYKI